MEHLAVASRLSLHEFCDRFREILDLPALQFDCENETEWGIVELNDVEYNVSRPYEEGTLQDWDETVPIGCNIGISLILYREHPNADDDDWAVTHLVAPIGQQLADNFDTPVYHHRTWCGPGENIRQDRIFQPRVT